MCYHVLTKCGNIISISTFQIVKTWNLQRKMGQRYIEVSTKKIMISPIQLRDYVCDKPIPEDSYEMMDEDDEYCEEIKQVYNDSNVPDANVSHLK